MRKVSAHASNKQLIYFHCGMHVPGAWAEHYVVKEGDLAKLPDGIPLNIAGGIPLVSLTAWQSLHEGNPQPGKRVLVHAAAGGVGHIAVQIAKALGMFVVSGAAVWGRIVDRSMPCSVLNSDRCYIHISCGDMHEHTVSV